MLALPLGVWLGHIHRGSFFAINIGNVGRALPSLAVLAIGDAFLGLGLPVVELALVVLALRADRDQLPTSASTRSTPTSSTRPAAWA